jgi:hypothetical protein
MHVVGCHCKKRAFLSGDTSIFLQIMMIHTSKNSFYMWTKISSLEIDIFDLKMMVKSGLDFFILSPFRAAAAQCKKICPERLNWPGRLAVVNM